MNLNFFYWIPIVVFGSIYLIKTLKNIIQVNFNQEEKIPTKLTQILKESDRT